MEDLMNGQEPQEKICFPAPEFSISKNPDTGEICRVFPKNSLDFKERYYTTVVFFGNFLRDRHSLSSYLSSLEFLTGKSLSRGMGMFSQMASALIGLKVQPEEFLVTFLVRNNSPAKGLTWEALSDEWKELIGKTTFSYTKKKSTVCVWHVDCEDFGTWSSSCPEGSTFCFADGGPRDNGFRFCPYCGKPLQEEVPETKEDTSSSGH